MKSSKKARPAAKRPRKPGAPRVAPTAKRTADVTLDDEARIVRECCEDDLATFVKEAWPIVVPGDPLQWNWHMDAVCDHLQAVAELQIQRLLITIPPRHAKSTLACVMFPAWFWLRDPALKMVYSSYSQTLSTRDSRLTRLVIDSPWYQTNWESKFSISADQNEKMRFENDKRGFRLATSVGGANTGEGGALIVVDDPHNVLEAESDLQRDAVIDWWNTVMSTRSNDPKTERRIVIGQRTHERDLAADILEKGGYTHLNLPVRFEKSRVISMFVGKDPRTEEGELLWKGRYDAPAVKRLEATLGPRAAAAQLQQRPTPLEGGLFKRAWWKFYDIDPRVMAEGCDDSCWSWDAAFKDFDDSDYVVGQLWVRKGANFYLIAQVRDRLSFGATKAAVRTTSAAWPKIGAKLIEDKANGTAVVDDLKSVVPGLIPVEPKGGKEARASSVEPYVAAGNVWLPARAPWVEAYIEELAAFPKGAYDDQVDATSQAIVWLRERFLTGSSGETSAFTKSTVQKPQERYRDPRYG
jgi:predicted phage terminase large subunit-like protein